MSEWAYRDCTCGNRVHINFTCNKCDGDPWGVRKDMQGAIDAMERHLVKLMKETNECKAYIKGMKTILRKTHINKKTGAWDKK